MSQQEFVPQSQSHEQEFVSPFARKQGLIRDHAMALFFDQPQPVFRVLFGCNRMAPVCDVEPAMGAGPDPGIFM